MHSGTAIMVGYYALQKSGRNCSGIAESRKYGLNNKSE